MVKYDNVSSEVDKKNFHFSYQQTPCIQKVELRFTPSAQTFYSFIKLLICKNYGFFGRIQAAGGWRVSFVLIIFSSFQYFSPHALHRVCLRRKNTK